MAALDFAHVGNELARAAFSHTPRSVEDLLDLSVKGEKLRDKVTAAVAKLGEDLAVRRMTRLEAPGSGFVASYVHAGGKIGVLVEINCESDFVARTNEFQQLCHDIAMHIAAVDPRYMRREEVTPEMLAKERDIYREQAKAAGKPEAMIERIVTGKMEKFYEESCLYEQHFIKDETMTIGEKIAQAIAKLGENIAIRRFARFKVGEVPNQIGTPAPEQA